MLWLAARVENVGMGLVSILRPRAMERRFDTPPAWASSACPCLGHAALDDDAPRLTRQGRWQGDAPLDWRS